MLYCIIRGLHRCNILLVPASLLRNYATLLSFLTQPLRIHSTISRSRILPCLSLHWEFSHSHILLAKEKTGNNKIKSKLASNVLLSFIDILEIYAKKFNVSFFYKQVYIIPQQLSI